MHALHMCSYTPQGLYLGAFTVGVVGTFTGLFKMIMVRRLVYSTLVLFSTQTCREASRRHELRVNCDRA